MNVVVIGLGKMGLNLVKNFNDKGISIIGHDVHKEIGDAYQHHLFTFSETFPNFSKDTENIVLLLLPSGTITNQVIDSLKNQLHSGDRVIDFSNSQYQVSIDNHKKLTDKGIKYHDCGLSGGWKGAREGACMMLGNSTEEDYEVHQLLQRVCRPNGFQYYDKPGSGHYLKMVHNGIEYAMMQAIAEGLQLLALQKHYEFDLYQVTENWSDGSIITSSLLEYVKEELKDSPNLSQFSEQVFASGEAKWMVEESLNSGIPIPTIAQSLMIRNASQLENQYANRVLSAMRFNFGGHNEIANTHR